MHTDEAPDRFEQVIRDMPEVLSCFKITGDSDYVLQVVASDLDSYADFLEKILRKQPGISSIQSSLTRREVKFQNSGTGQAVIIAIAAVGSMIARNCPSVHI